MSEKISIEVDSDFLKKFFKLGDMQAPAEVELDDMNKVIDKVLKKLETLASLQNHVPGSSQAAPAQNSSAAVDAPKNPKNVLVVDDLGIVTVQMESVLKKLGFDVTVSRELFDAIDKYKSQDFGYAIIDLFIPTEREGFILIDEIKKMSLLCKLNTKIVVMTASNKKEHKDKCMNRGASYYIEKMPGWQEKIAEICLGKVN